MKGLKFNIVLGGITSLLFLFLAGYVVKDIFTPFNKLNYDSSTIKKINLTYYNDRTRHIPQYDIYLFDKPYFIRISNDYEQYWKIINNSKNINKNIQYHFLTHVLNNSVLHNPSQLSIDGKIIYAYGSDLSNQKSLVVLLVLFSLILALLTYFAVKNYLRKSKSAL